MKTKQQKQAEAIERKRASLPRLRQAWHERLPGGSLHASLVAMHGLDHVIKSAGDAKRKLERMAAEAQCDIHGNPLT